MLPSFIWIIKMDPARKAAGVLKIVLRFCTVPSAVLPSGMEMAPCEGAWLR